MWQNLFNFFNQGWVGSLAGIIGILVGAVGIFSYKISRSTAKPSYQKSSLRLLGRNENNLPSDVTVLFKGEEVDRLTKTTLIFWNNGTEVLSGEDVVESDPICISLKDGESILSHKILKKTKDANEIKIIKDDENSKQIWVTFSYLDPEDGATLELLHNSEDLYPEISGTIKGLPNGFKDLGRVYPSRIPIRLINSNKLLRIVFGRPKLMAIQMMFVGIAMIVLGLLPQEARELLGVESLTESSEDKLNFDTSWVFIILGVFYTATSAPILWLWRKKYPKSLEIEEVEP